MATATAETIPRPCGWSAVHGIMATTTLRGPRPKPTGGASRPGGAIILMKTGQALTTRITKISRRSERYEAALVNFMDARQELLNARKAKGFKPPASSSSSKGGKGKGKGKRRKGKGKGKFRKGGKYKGKGKSKGKANLREDQKAAIAERHPPFKVLCAQGARRAAAFRVCRTQEKTSTHRLTYASWRPEGGTAKDEKWFQLSGVDAMTGTIAVDSLQIGLLLRYSGFRSSGGRRITSRCSTCSRGTR